MCVSQPSNRNLSLRTFRNSCYNYYSTFKTFGATDLPGEFTWTLRASRWHCYQEFLNEEMILTPSSVIVIMDGATATATGRQAEGGRAAARRSSASLSTRMPVARATSALPRYNARTVLRGSSIGVGKAAPTAELMD